ncbi:MAG: CRISPR-associated endonuclease Cas1 [Tannerella sp.]|jgi:group II intron reverse transcriptase/maturase/CRISPR-associated endonuclease Cas1|nr:CRISPR-associated endonuclease Cas1 [Tannerella sp.]
MPSPLFRTLCLPVTLHTAWKVVKLKNSAGGIDGLSVLQFEESSAEKLSALRQELLNKTWNPEPYLRVEIPKKTSEIRKLGLLSVRDKIVQQAIKTLIEPKLEKLFLNNSYGYRPGKGPVKAIHRGVNVFQQVKKGWVAKLDVDDYFDTIQHEQLFTRLQNLLQDEEIVRLIALCVKTGVVSKQLKWNEPEKGVPQGAVLSPLLANFYLHPFDRFVVGRTANYVRYADDFLVVSDNREQLNAIVRDIQSTLEKDFSLKLNTPVITDLETGAEFLGIWIKRSGLMLTEKKRKDLESRIDSVEWQNARLSDKSKETLQGIKNYYARLLPQSLLKELDCQLIVKIHDRIKQNRSSIRNKTTLNSGLQEIDFFADETNLSKPLLIKGCITTYLDLNKKEAGKKKKADNKKLINQKKREYQKREAEGSELAVNTPGCFIGKSNRGIIIKSQGQILNRKPTPALKHITVTGQGITLSSNAIAYCVEQHVPIDFFDARGQHYASIMSPISMDGLLWQQQALLPVEKKISLGGRIILSKLKNQENLIKYYHKYHKGAIDTLSEKYLEVILRMDECINKVKLYKENNPEYAPFFMSQEAVAAVAYWDYVRLLLHDDDVDFTKRERHGASDLMNSMLNYGYAILYARVWEAVLTQKLNPSISVLHAPQAGKPTFVYDVVELFRAQAVDRVVISLIQKREPLKMNKNLLSESTKNLLLEHLFERLNRYEKYRGEEIRFIEIIHRQVREIAAFISGESKTYKPYLAKW